MQETQVLSLGQEDPLKEGMATHSSILAWRIPWTEEPGELQSIGLQRVRHNLANKQQQQQRFRCGGGGAHLIIFLESMKTRWWMIMYYVNVTKE